MLASADALKLGEVIAKLFAPSGDPQRFVTHWGLDPIWGSARVDAGPYIHQFPLRRAVGHAVSLLEAPGDDVTVVGHQPHFDETRKLWYCDLQLDAGAAYYPFVRLALARYQPHSIPGQPAPISGRLSGARAARRGADVGADARRAGRGRGLPERPGRVHARRGKHGGSRRPTPAARAVALCRRPNRAPLKERGHTDLAWMPIGDEGRLALSATRGLGDVSYTGTVPLPPQDDAYELRVALHEYEIFETDESEAEDHFVRQLPVGDFFVLDRPVRYRLVFADHMSL